MTTQYERALEYFEVIWRQASGVDVELNKAIRRALLIADAVFNEETRQPEGEREDYCSGYYDGWNDCLEHLRKI